MQHNFCSYHAGVQLSGLAVAGTVICFFPGTVVSTAHDDIHVHVHSHSTCVVLSVFSTTSMMLVSTCFTTRKYKQKFGMYMYIIC